ncbi:ferric-chelate reductase Frp1 [Recurvomyces mirabilis]|uniref:ferric-chelate reductase (NADPH) n=1 Tax=Recurvomyces mirabilis TaxID=574656 RepID=A0AAE0WMI9_9PEZI|nr:ferric-chelate reductase Frp1 [Recurvomyces mirabilis]KAK5158493.1 ferric-chelate reductase Frp1 [Recurvomyces mirabilis]
MDGMNMDMGGMDMTSEGMFTSTNRGIAQNYWYGIVVAIGCFVLARVVSTLQRCERLQKRFFAGKSVPSRPSTLLARTHATVIAIMREMTYPQPVYFVGTISRYFTPLPLGRWIIITIYWTVLLIFLWSDTVLRPDDPMYAYKWEKVGFRAAWVTVAQIPSLYLLSMKFSPLTFLTGISYERINWLHRWAARTVFLTAILHWSFFLREWWLADFVELEIQMMPMVRWGFGAFGILAWMIISGFGFFRARAYEIFVAQHIASAAVFLWLLYCHVPAYNRSYVWASVAFFAFDFTTRIVWSFWRNIHLRGRLPRIGYSARLECLPGEVVRLQINDVGFRWNAGQHAFICIPRLRPFELHPFTIANAAQPRDARAKQQKFTMLIKARSGFTRSLYRAAACANKGDCVFTVFLSGPWGAPPKLHHYDTVVMIACSTGASFAVPLVDDLVHNPGCVRSITLHWIIRHEDHFARCEQELHGLIATAKECALQLRVCVHVTQGMNRGLQTVRCMVSEDEGEFRSALFRHTLAESVSMTSSTSSADETKLLSYNQQAASLDKVYGCRPTVDSMIRPPVEAALGETAVVVCGGLSITAQARNSAAGLSDERAVHKGTNAEGIYLFTESYGW